jgi:L-ectoine synthase
MIVKTLEDIEGTSADTRGPDWSSQRFFLASDGMGYTLTETTVEAGFDHILWYKNHIEACYCFKGSGEVENLTTGEKHAIKPGTLYALDQHDRHALRAFTKMKLVCVFTPALTGGETHDEDGSYSMAKQ